MHSAAQTFGRGRRQRRPPHAYCPLRPRARPAVALAPHSHLRGQRASPAGPGRTGRAARRFGAVFRGQVVQDRRELLVRRFGAEADHFVDGLLPLSPRPPRAHDALRRVADSADLLERRGTAGRDRWLCAANGRGETRGSRSSNSQQHVPVCDRHASPILRADAIIVQARGPPPASSARVRIRGSFLRRSRIQTTDVGGRPAIP